ncbi:nitroreductase family deazaflavin-dependent oxidoreductase [Streptomyces atratus]|uniref:nitroreductase family deazaflavin-dependent oxidoreductase n=1 Tax=Streptomyces atratus TaxID=1893 RepID=UPI0033E2DD20
MSAGRTPARSKAGRPEAAAPRTTPLACMPEYGSEGDGVTGRILTGSNFGRPGHPAWTADLLAHPDDAVINGKGHDIAVRARLLEGAERAEVWQAALTFWPPYATYQARVEREIRLFRLERRGTS